jgi:hypothetical protein
VFVVKQNYKLELSRQYMPYSSLIFIPDNSD